jgi:hypothetical protein
MKMLRSLLLALPVVGLCGPAMAGAGQLSGNYLLTITASHGGNSKGQQACVTLNEDGSFLGWQNSGTVTIGDATGNFFVAGSNLLATASNGGTSFIFTGFLHDQGIRPAQFETLTNGVGTDSGLFTVVRGGC